MSSNKERQKRQAFSVKSHVEGRAVAGRGIGAVQLPDNVKFYKFSKKGSVRIDILMYRSSRPDLHPYAIDDLWYEKTYFVHRNVGTDSATVICPKATFKKPCPICEYRNSLDRNDEEDQKRIKALYPQERQLFNVIVHDDGKSSDVMVLDQSRFGFGKIIDEMVCEADEEDAHYQNYPDIEKGSTLKVNVDEMSGGGFKYFGASSIEFKQRKRDYDESILDETVDLDTVLNEISYNELKDMFFGTGKFDPTNQQSTEESQEKSKKGSKPAKQKPVDDDEDDDEPPAKSMDKKGVVDDFDEDEPPAKSKPKAKSLVDDDDDDEPPAKSKAAAKPKAKPPVDDDDDEDEPPAKSKPATKPAETKKSIPVEDWDDDDED